MTVVNPGAKAADRDEFAAEAHVNAPSDETWRQVVAGVLARKPIGEKP